MMKQAESLVKTGITWLLLRPTKQRLISIVNGGTNDQFKDQRLMLALELAPFEVGLVSGPEPVDLLHYLIPLRLGYPHLRRRLLQNYLIY